MSLRSVEPVADEPHETLYCANHPTVPTYLRCGRCEKPICARCRVATPVGYRCVQCAGLTVLPTYAVSGSSYGRAVAFGFGFATLLGIVWAFLPGFDFWACLALGIGAGEAVSAAANMKRGPGLQVVGVLAAIWGIVVSRVALAFYLTVPALLSVIEGIPGNAGASALRGPLAIGQLLTRPDVPGLLFLAMALLLAYVRLR